MTRATLVALGLGSLVSVLPLQALQASRSHTVERVVYLMGTRATLAVEAADRPTAVRQLEEMVQSLEQTEAVLSTWRGDSVLSTLNRQPVAAPLDLPPSVCALWSELTAWHRETEGAFDPAVGTLIEAWGLRDGGRRALSDELAAARATTGMAHFRFDAAACRVTRLAAVKLDAGAFGKGAALRRLLRSHTGSGPWMADLGGQVVVSGAPRDGWRVALAHPARRADTLLELALRGGSLATSGASERSFEVEGERIAHILDPRTGRPVARRESVTVWHQDPLAADILSTALYVMGPEAGLRYAEAHRVSALFLVPSGAGAGGDATVTLRPSRAFRHRFPAVEGVVGHDPSR
jgi:thiamine biosynthesis lipoprotein